MDAVTSFLNSKIDVTVYFIFMFRNAEILFGMGDILSLVRRAARGCVGNRLTVHWSIIEKSGTCIANFGRDTSEDSIRIHQFR